MKDLQRLEALVADLSAQATLVDKTRGEAARPLFDEHLFRSRSKLLAPCVNEIRNEIQALNREQLTGHLLASRTQHVCEKIVAQIQAIQRELATQQIRKNEPKPRQGWRKPVQQLYQDLAQHQEWERRLADTLRDKEMLLSRTTSPSERQQLQQAVLAYEGRLNRCRAALVKIEKAIGQQERKH
ncbi:prepilin peptidase [Photobacterium aquae]|uniref:Prepilin peptidase n=1 Tax=Photobacterium aquae TaxID=1195763 RepID=A0A0J1HC30_9GAMM|nr:primosomal replication protein [Photobacterium aquae]KLV09213.1 prepilin peptidase [Photobacterium aquae]